MPPDGLDRDVTTDCDLFEAFAGDQQVQNLLFAGRKTTHAGSELGRQAVTFVFRAAGEGLLDVIEKNLVVHGFLQKSRLPLPLNACLQVGTSPCAVIKMMGNPMPRSPRRC